jgi:hypothetical protein
MARPPMRHVAAAATLAREDADGRAAYLTARSGLPGPRANLELAQAYAEVAEPEEARALAAGDDEYLALCGALALAARAADPALAGAVRAAATDGAGGCGRASRSASSGSRPPMRPPSSACWTTGPPIRIRSCTGRGSPPSASHPC